MKNQPWTKEDLKELDLLQATGKSLDDIALTLDRTREAIKIKLGRVLFEKVRVCKDCGRKIFNAHFNRQRCVVCSKKHSDEYHKLTSARLHVLKKNEINSRRLFIRWGKKRDEVLKRDNYKCVKCGLTREEHFKKYGKDIIVYNPNVKNRKNRKYIEDDIKELITVCLSCQGVLRVKHRSKDYSNCGGKFGMKKETLKEERTVRCQNCFKTFKIYYDPIKHYDRFRNQKCEHCGEKFNYTKKEHIDINSD